jgi:hypothetical protein
MRNTAADLKGRNPMLPPAETIVEVDTQRWKTNPEHGTYTRWNDLPYDDGVLVFEDIASLKAEIVPYHKEQILYIAGSSSMYFHDSADTASVDDGLTVLVDSSGRRLKKVGKVAAAQADSVAIDAAGIVADFNALLAKLRAAGIMKA